MAVAFHRRLAVPLWALAAGAAAFSTSPGVMPVLIVVFGIAVTVSAIPAIVRRLRSYRTGVEVLPAPRQDSAPAAFTMTAGSRTRTLEQARDARTLQADDTADLVRMDDDGGSPPRPRTVVTLDPV